MGTLDSITYVLETVLRTYMGTGDSTTIFGWRLCRFWEVVHTVVRTYVYFSNVSVAK